MSAGAPVLLQSYRPGSLAALLATDQTGGGLVAGLELLAVDGRAVAEFGGFKAVLAGIGDGWRRANGAAADGAPLRLDLAPPPAGAVVADPTPPAPPPVRVAVWAVALPSHPEERGGRWRVRMSLQKWVDAAYALRQRGGAVRRSGLVACPHTSATAGARA